MTALSYTGGGAFATTRRGGLTGEQVREIEAHRCRDRPTPWQALAKRYGVAEADIRALFVEEQKTDKLSEAVEYFLNLTATEQRSIAETLMARAA